jgi:hypothetical protein
MKIIDKINHHIEVFCLLFARKARMLNINPPKNEQMRYRIRSSTGDPESEVCFFLPITRYHFPNIDLMIVRPTLRSIPPFVVGMPVFLAKEFFAPDIPNNRFQEKENPYLLICKGFLWLI